ncbi:MAG: ABC transporter substrate-binding protein ['Conium maculatum' witches'-broom phytoplasma]|nr:ABC transporter substrate-binding protein ['Conium maculatum' witches'-broom phytoplasma]
MIKKDNKFLKYINKNKKTSIIVLLVIILLMGTFLYNFRSINKKNNSKQTDTLYVATAAPMQPGFGMYNVGSRTVYNNMIRNLIHEPLLIPKTELTEGKKYEKTTYESNILVLDKSKDSDSSSKTKTYVLKDNIKFHNGETLIVDDILYSWEKTKELGLESSRYIERFEKVKDDPKKFTVTFKNANNNMNEFYLSKVFVINKQECEKNFNEGISIGLGIFKLKPIKHDTIVQLELFDKHPNVENKNPAIKKIHFQYYPDSGTCFLRTKNEDIDILIEPTNENIFEIRNQKINNLKTVKNDFLNLEFILLNNDRLDFDKRKILYDIIQANKKTILDQLLKNQTNEDERKNYKEIDSFSDPRLIGGTMEEANKPTDSAEAEQNNQSTINDFKTELTKKPLQILITQDDNNLRNRFLSKLQVVLEEIGFKCKLEKTDFNTMLETAQKGEFDIVSFSDSLSNTYPHYVLKQYFGRINDSAKGKERFKTVEGKTIDGIMNVSSFKNKVLLKNNEENGNNNYVWTLLDEIDQLPIEQKPPQKTEKNSDTKPVQTDLNSYPEKIKQIQTILKENYVYVPLFSKQQKISITRKQIQGFTMDAFGNINWLGITKEQ